MADRSVTVASDDSSDLPEITGVRTLGKRNLTDADSDVFSSRIEDSKVLKGVGPNFKRKVTTELRKYRRGTEGQAESKAINEETFITGYDAFDVVEPPYNLEYLSKLYELSSPHYAAVNAKVANIVGLGYKLVENTLSKRNLERAADAKNSKAKVENLRRNLAQHKEDVIESLEGFNEEDTFTETLIKVWRDYEVTGNGYIEVGRKKDGKIGYVGHIPAQTVRIRRKRDGFVQMSGFKVQFFANFGYANDKNPLGGDKPNEIIHLKRYSPTSTFYGVPDVVAAKQAIAGNEFASRYNLDYFENKAVPRYAIILKGARLGATAEDSLLSFFETSLKGQNHRSIYIPLPGDTAENKVEFKLQAIEAGTQDSSFNNYRKANIADILMAHRVPISKVSVAEGASLAIARDADKTFKEQVCAPEQRIAEKKINRIVKDLTDAFDFKLNEMTLTDENTQSQIYERYRKTGVLTGNEVRIELGYPTIDGGDALVDLNAKAAPASAGNTSRERDATRSANATDSAGEARNPKGDGRTTP